MTNTNVIEMPTPSKVFMAAIVAGATPDDAMFAAIAAFPRLSAEDVQARIGGEAAEYATAWRMFNGAHNEGL